MLRTVAAFSGALVLATAFWPFGTAAQQSTGLDGAYVAHETTCADVFVRAKSGYRYGNNRSAFAAALLIRGQSISTPIATCQIVRLSGKDGLMRLDLNCSNSVSYAPLKAYLRKNQDGSITRLASPDDARGDKYEACPR